jgi:GWxTD domain-containing protein
MFSWILSVLIFSVPEFLSAPGTVHDSAFPIWGRAYSFTVDSARCYVELDYLLVVPDTEANRFRLQFFLYQQDSLQMNRAWDRLVAHPQAGQLVVEPLGLSVAPGPYRGDLQVVWGTDSGRVRLPFRCAPEREDSLHLSAIQLLWSLSEADSGPFVKYGKLNAFPNPIHQYSLSRDTLYFLAEVYGLAEDTTPYVLRSAVMDSTGRVVVTGGWMKFPRMAGKRGLVFGGFPLPLDRTGRFRLVLEVVDPVTGHRTRARAPFVFDAEIRTYMDSLIAFIDYVATPEELRTFQSLTSPRARWLFLKKFWAKRDPDPETPRNEFLETFLRRCQIADRRFSEMGRAGRKTDRGRIYIKYGPPQDVERYTLTGDLPDQVHWTYESPKYFYVFMDIDGSGHWVLVYTDNPHEPYTRGYESLINRAP